ncbi:MAG: hypothetical protein U1F56_14315 [Rubrivivax sp.]
MSRSPLTEARLRLHDEALVRAHALRREAIDDFWRGAGQALGDASTQALRASERLLARWRRHLATRGA